MAVPLLGKTRRALVAALLVGSAALPGAACTVGDEVIEGKKCYSTGTDPNQHCLKGYECKCGGGECTCQKSSALGPSPEGPTGGVAIPAAAAAPAHVLTDAAGRAGDPSRLFLQRLGLTLDD